VHVPPVEDELEDGPAVVDRRGDGAGGAVADARHRVEGVGQEPRSAVEGGACRVVVRLRVADGDDDPRRSEAVDGIERAGQLRSDRDLAQRAPGGLEQSLHGRPVRAEEAGGIVRAPPSGSEEGTLEVRAEDAGVRGAERGDQAQPLLELVHPGGDETQDDPRGAVPVMQGDRGEDLRGAPRVVGEARPAVPVQVDEAGDDPAAGGVHDLGAVPKASPPVALAGLRDPTADTPHPAGRAHAVRVDQRRGVDDPGVHRGCQYGLFAYTYR
jgi:hypothetical protein